MLKVCVICDGESVQQCVPGAGLIGEGAGLGRGSGECHNLRERVGTRSPHDRLLEIPQPSVPRLRRRAAVVNAGTVEGQPCSSTSTGGWDSHPMTLERISALVPSRAESHRAPRSFPWTAAPNFTSAKK